MIARTVLIIVVSSMTVIEPAQAADPFAANIRPTDPLTPEQQRETFQLPPGFEIQLFASEPDVLKPMNMAFDSQGRLWLTESIEYPYAAPLDRKGRDNVKILSDTDGDGRADKIVTFAHGLNIPIGICPIQNGAIVWSIPNIWKMEDLDGDDVADRRTKLYGPMGYERDTHGMNNSFRRGFDGWIYACHGFNNHTKVAGSDGHQIEMQSGSTYRFRDDGSRIEHFTHGQVNPFGMAMDPLGNFFTADCHSKPLYQLTRGGYYPSFGKPHDGLGFVPPMMSHTHNSTAIAGAAHYTGEDFPAEYQGNLFSGNVMTSRVNRNSLVEHGATILAKEEADLVATTDPWFRPVDVQIGPDGALYIADFYNRIIGHYEVPLDHPGRDSKRGRIWRVVYRGENGHDKPQDLTAANVDELLEALADSSLVTRRLATNELVGRIGPACAAQLRETWQASADSRVKVHTLWALHRLGECDLELLSRAAADSDRQVRVHAMKALAEADPWSDSHRLLALKALEDADAFVRRAAADALAQHPHVESVKPLITLVQNTAPDDPMLRYVARKSLRDQLRSKDVFASVQEMPLSDTEKKSLADVAIAVASEEAAAFLLQHCQHENLADDALIANIRHIALHTPIDRVGEVVSLARSSFSGRGELQAELIRSVRDGLSRRGESPTPALVVWASYVAQSMLQSVEKERSPWVNRFVLGGGSENPWTLQRRPSSDGDHDSWFLCSLPHGEQLTGRLRSPEFIVPAEMSFYVAGHNGHPLRPLVERNVVHLRDAATGELLAQTAAPRNDTAQQVHWQLEPHQGKRAYVALVDSDSHGAYAWLAAGRFDAPGLNLPAVSPRQVDQRCQTAAELIQSMKLVSLLPRLLKTLQQSSIGSTAIEALATAAADLKGDVRLSALAPLAASPQTSPALRREILSQFAADDSSKLSDTLIKAMKESSASLQTNMARELSSDRQGASALLSLVEGGHASARLLLDATVNAKLAAQSDEEISRRAGKLTQNLSPIDEKIHTLMQQRIAKYSQTGGDTAPGAALFVKHCASCHQVQGKGAVIGPQLDGIGNRGLARVTEDVLDPHRNVDAAFRTSTLVMLNGKVLTGLVRREEGQSLILADSKGKETAIPLAEIEERRATSLSLMPSNVTEILSESEFYDLLAFLLSLKQAPDSSTGASE